MNFFVLAAQALISVSSAQPTLNPCGPNFESFVVTESNQYGPRALVRGLRCVARNVNPAVVWYGEGQWSNTGYYQHLGIATTQPFNPSAPLQATMADFAAYENQYPSIRDSASHQLQLIATPFGFQLIGSDINENWYRPQFPVAYTASGLVAGCGRNFQEYRVENYGADANSLRCLLRTRDGLGTVWYGEGAWGANTYKHIGYGAFNGQTSGFGLFDLCTVGTHYCAPREQRDIGSISLNYSDCRSSIEIPGYNSCITLEQRNLRTGASELTEYWSPARHVRHHAPRVNIIIPQRPQGTVIGRPGRQPQPRAPFPGRPGLGGGVVIVN